MTYKELLEDFCARMLPFIGSSTSLLTGRYRAFWFRSIVLIGGHKYVRDEAMSTFFYIENIYRNQISIPVKWYNNERILLDAGMLSCMGKKHPGIFKEQEWGYAHSFKVAGKKDAVIVQPKHLKW